MAVQYIILNADTETNGFHKPVKIGDTYVNGADHHALMEVAVQFLDKDDQLLDDAHHYILDPKRIDNWNESTREFHLKSHDEDTKPFLETWEEAQKVSLGLMEQELIAKIKKIYPEANGQATPRDPIQFILCARSVNFDIAFINAQMPELAGYISHQAFDITSFRLALRLFHPTLKHLVHGETNHNAYDDCEFIRDELKEIRHLVESIPTEQTVYKDYRIHEDKPMTWTDLWYAFVGKLLS